MKLVKVEGHFKTKHPLYQTYKGMLSRCNHVNSKYYSYYGGRGIKVAKRWTGPTGFKHFVEDMGSKPDGTTLDRKNNNGNYSKYNCRWVSMTEQSLNRRLANVNTSGVAGVHFFKAANMWSAYIDFKRKRKNLGYFHSFADAVVARREAEIERSQLINKGVSHG